MNTEVYVYGISTGIFFTMFLCFLLFVFCQLSYSKEKKASKLFLYGSIATLCFIFFDIYTIPTATAVIIFPSWVLFLGKISAPLGAFMNFQMFIKSIPLRSLEIFLLWKKYKKLYPFIYIILFSIFISVCFLTDQRLVIIVSFIAMIINHLLCVPLAHHTLQSIYVSKTYIQILSVLAGILFCCVLMLIFGDINDLSTLHQSLAHTLISAIVLIYNFVLCRYIIEGSCQSGNMFSHHINHLYPKVYQALNNNEFFIEYQAQVDLKTSKIKGMKALIRWQHPRDGLIPPSDFIPTSEQTQLINSICEWVINQVMLDIKVMHTQGIELPISIDFSVKNLNQKMVNFLHNSIQDNEIAPSSIFIEINESVFFDMNEEVKNSLSMLHNIGVSISIDDFGAGHCSLSHLSDMELNEVKIDKLLVDKTLNPKQHHILLAIMEMSQALGIKVVIEGVNDVETVKSLLNINCALGQGYSICLPKRLDDVIKWIHTGYIVELN